MPKMIALAPEVLDVLQRSEIGENFLVLPQQLPRDLYVKTNKAIEAAGGKWNRKAGRHVFEFDPRVALGMAVETGKIINQQQTFQEFWTPIWLADKMCGDLPVGARVLEPSAGIGRIAKAAASAGGRVVCCELQEKLVALLREDDRLAVRPAGDFLQLTADFLLPFDYVLMNPPFTNGQEFAHVRHAFDFLKPGGMLRAVMSPGLKFHEKGPGRDFREWFWVSPDVANYYCQDLPPNTFAESGTCVNTVLLEIVKAG